MGKLFSKIAALSVGLAMAVGVGVAAGSNSTKIVSADGTVVDWNAIVSGEKYFITATYNSTQYALKTGYFSAGNSTVQSFTNPNSLSESDAWTFTKNGDCWKISCIVGSYTDYLSCTNNNNGVRSGNTQVDWTITSADAKDSTLAYLTSPDTANPANTRYLALYQGTNYRCYTNTNNGVPKLKLYHYTAPAQSVKLNSISLSNQSLSVTETFNIYNNVTFDPENATNKALTYSLSSGSNFIDLNTETGVVTAKKGGSGVVTITPEDTSGGASAINVTFTIASIAAPYAVVGNDYVIYAIDTANSYSGELTGVSDGNVGTVAQITSGTPSCSYVLSVEEGYFENTVAFKNGTKYLSLNSAANNLYTSNSINANSSWVVTYDSENDLAVIRNGAFNRYIMFNYNKGNPRFACYVSGQTGVKLYPYSVKPLEDFELEDDFEIYIAEQHNIVVAYDPADASDKDGITWVSGTPSVATVDETGKVTGVAVGTSVITASKTINAVNVQRTVTVTVKNNVASHEGNEADPFNVEDAFYVAAGIFTKVKSGTSVSLSDTEYYVTGTITSNTARTTSNLSFWIGDNQSQTSAATGGFEVYKAAKVYGTALGTAYTENNKVTEDFDVGYKVTVKAKFTFHGGTTSETAQNTADIIYNSYIEARKYAEAFNSAFEAICNEETGNSNVSQLATAWGNQKTAFNALEPEEKAHLTGATAKTTSNAKTVEKCAAKYDYIAGKYQTQLAEEYDFMGRNPKSINSSLVIGDNSQTENMSTLLIVIASITAVTIIGTLVLARKKER